jgi:cytochrome P450
VASFCLLLAQHPDTLVRARQEQEQFAWDEPLTMDQLKQMTYLETVLKEALRLISPVGGGFRRFTQSCEFNGYSIPQGWNAIYQISETHKDSCIYSQPEKFDPDRFCPARAEDKQKQFSYVPFGGGPRECLGLSYAYLLMKVFAVYLIRGYNWELLPNQNLTLEMIPTPHPRDGLKVHFHQR